MGDSEEQPHASKKKRSSASVDSLKKEDAQAEVPVEGEVASTEAAEGKKDRHILFVGTLTRQATCVMLNAAGNLPFTATVDDIKKHFDHWGSNARGHG